MRNRLEKITNNATRGIEAFSKNPVKHTLDATLGFAKDYWDLGAAVLCGLAWTDYNSKTIGDANLRAAMMLGLPFVSAAGAVFTGHPNDGTYRLYSNIAGGLGALFGTFGRGIPGQNFNAMDNVLVPGVFGAVVYNLDLGIRGNKRIRESNYSSTFSKAPTIPNN